MDTEGARVESPADAPPAARVPAISVGAAWLDGARRVARAPWLLAGTLLASLAVAAPLAWVVRRAVASDLGASTAADAAAAGVNWTWWQEFASRASGVAATLSPTVIGFAAPLRNVSDLVDGVGPPPALVGAVLAWGVLWTFLTGGLLDRLARDRRVGAYGFFAASGVHFFRFLRLALLAAPVYVFVFAVLQPWLLDDVYEWMTRSMTVERQAFAVRVALYGVLGAVLLPLSVLLDYARIRIVVEDRHSAAGAVLAALRFVRRHAAAVAGLYAWNVAGWLVVLLVYAVVAPGAGRAGWTAWLGLVVGQAYVLARIWVKLQFLASQTALFQGRLAHAGYVAAPEPAWPESPTAEAIRRLPPA